MKDFTDILKKKNNIKIVQNKCSNLYLSYVKCRLKFPNIKFPCNFYISQLNKCILKK